MVPACLLDRETLTLWGKVGFPLRKRSTSLRKA